ncbi:hypothetical protein Y032_0018g3560 [Ancylostoma ceylanicum]|uniref:Uncharacterized protein n=1 Tax=Ancylostoma ceylanicum TaxID=53326 RepID=A0A016V491_9BILA|nr:hypothetical protein Y032_0018g3560 [Ancylostoma ceylanicum]
MRLACDFQTHASISGRFSLKTGQRGMIPNEKNARPSRGRKRVRLSCGCDETGPYSSPYIRTRVSRTHPV